MEETKKKPSTRKKKTTPITEEIKSLVSDGGRFRLNEKNQLVIGVSDIGHGVNCISDASLYLLKDAVSTEDGSISFLEQDVQLLRFHTRMTVEGGGEQVANGATTRQVLMAVAHRHAALAADGRAIPGHERFMSCLFAAISVLPEEYAPASDTLQEPDPVTEPTLEPAAQVEEWPSDSHPQWKAQGLYVSADGSDDTVTAVFSKEPDENPLDVLASLVEMVRETDPTITLLKRFRSGRPIFSVGCDATVNRVEVHMTDATSVWLQLRPVDLERDSALLSFMALVQKFRPAK